MALSTRKKNIIISDWKTGIYKSKLALAKHHKVDAKTVGKLIDGITQDNADLVEASVIVENAKKSLKNPVEITSVENAVKMLTENQHKVNNITNDILDGIHKLIKGGKAQKIVTEGGGKGFSSARVIEHDLQASDYKNAIDAVDKASVTIGVNDRFNSSQVAIQNNNQVNNNLIEEEIIITKKDY